MAATRTDIKTWFMDGLAKGYSHMLVVCDEFDYEDYPVYGGYRPAGRPGFPPPPTNWLQTLVAEKNAEPMQRVIEVYDLRANLLNQLNEHCAWHVTEPVDVEDTIAGLLDLLEETSDGRHTRDGVTSGTEGGAVAQRKGTAVPDDPPDRRP